MMKNRPFISMKKTSYFKLTILCKWEIIAARPGDAMTSHLLKMLFCSSIYEISHIHITFSPSTGIITNSQSDHLPVSLIAQLVRALHRYSSSCGFESRSSQKFFQALFSQLLKSNAQL